MLTFRKYDDYAEVSDCNVLALKIEVPSEIDSLPVTEIADSAFGNCSTLKTVTLPESIKKVGGTAFSGCSSLTSLKFRMV